MQVRHGMSASIMTLMIEEHNTMQVFEFRETPESVIIMDYYPLRNIMDAGIVHEKSYVSTLGQILDGLRTLFLRPYKQTLTHPFHVTPSSN